MTEVGVIKKQMRTEMRKVLNVLSSDVINDKSTEAISRLRSMSIYQNSKVISIYLAMPKELQTYDLINHAFDSGKRVFIPKIVGSKSEDMKMIEIFSYQEIQQFPKDKWGIPDPPPDLVIERPDGTFENAIDLVLLPGLIFDKNCGRIGHGKGYYDCFLERLGKAYGASHKPLPIKIGLALDEQIKEEVPMAAHDTYLDFVVTATTTYEHKSTLLEKRYLPLRLGTLVIFAFHVYGIYLTLFHQWRKS